MRKNSLPVMCVLIFLSVALSACCCKKQSPFKTADYKDPFEYCGAVRNADLPGAPFDGPALPPVIIDWLRKSVNGEKIPEDVMKAGSFWRCMDGKVYACFTGANIPCTAKADTTKTPNVEMLRFCTENPESEVIPAYVTGRMTVYSWRCRHGLPETVQQVAYPDANGFISNYWIEIKPPSKNGK